MKQLTEEVWKHAKEVHGYTDEQILDPKMMEAVKAAIKRE
jgi:predicted small metal-binding protein